LRMLESFHHRGRGEHRGNLQKGKAGSVLDSALCCIIMSLCFRG